MLQRGGLYRIVALVCGIMALTSIVGCGNSNSSGINGTNQRFYIADTLNSRIIRTDDLSGTNWTSFGTIGTGTDYLDRPTGIAFDSANNLYIVDSGNNRIVRMSDFSGTNWTTITGNPTSNDFFDRPSQIVIDSSNNVYVTDTGNNRIVMFNAGSTANFNSAAGWTTLGSLGTGTNQFNNPTGIYLDSQNHIDIADTGNNRIVTINNISGAGWSTFGALGSTAYHFNAPGGIAQDASGLFYITDSGNNRIVRVSGLTGSNVNWTTLGTGLGDTLSTFSDPTAITIYNYASSATTSIPYIYIVDTGNCRVIRYVNITDTNPLVIGLPGADVYQLSSPQGIIVHK